MCYCYVCKILPFTLLSEVWVFNLIRTIKLKHVVNPKVLIFNINKLGRHTGIMGIKYPSKNHPQTLPATHSVASRPETYVSHNSGNISFPFVIKTNYSFMKYIMPNLRLWKTIFHNLHKSGPSSNPKKLTLKNTCIA